MLLVLLSKLLRFTHLHESLFQISFNSHRVFQIHEAHPCIARNFYRSPCSGCGLSGTMANVCLVIVDSAGGSIGHVCAKDFSLKGLLGCLSVVSDA